MNHSATGHDTQSIDPTRPNWMELGLEALDHNFRLIQVLSGPGVRIIPCVKCAAFGLALQEVANRLVSLGVETLFCGSYEDAKILRSSGLKKTDLVIFGCTLPAGIPAYLHLDLIPTVHHMDIASAVSSYASKPTRIYVKVDAGRGRLGFPIRTAEESILRLARMRNLVIEGIYTHLPFTDAQGAHWAQERTELFNDLINRLRHKGLTVPVTQARSSSGVLYGIRDRSNAVAVGSILYGKNSLPDGMVDFSTFSPLLRTIRTRLIHIAPDAADRTPETYNRYAKYVTGATGVVPFGRKDGFPVVRSGQKSFMIVNGAAAPVLSVSSEQAVLDLSEVSEPKVGDDVIILGQQSGLEITLADLARWADVTMNDVLLMMRGRVPKIINP